jgi:hypothetical protein
MGKKQPTVYVICGFIGAGKTTFARKLEKQTGAIRVTKDEWIIKIFGNKIASDKNFGVFDKNITELATDIVFKILRAGTDVIIDEGFWVKSQRDDIKKKILDVGAKPIFYYVECPVEKMRKRVVSRNKGSSIDSFEISEEMFDRYLKYWEPPKKEEGMLLAS